MGRTITITVEAVEKRAKALIRRAGGTRCSCGNRDHTPDCRVTREFALACSIVSGHLYDEASNGADRVQFEVAMATPAHQLQDEPVLRRCVHCRALTHHMVVDTPCHVDNGACLRFLQSKADGEQAAAHARWKASGYTDEAQWLKVKAARARMHQCMTLLNPRAPAEVCDSCGGEMVHRPMGGQFCPICDTSGNCRRCRINRNLCCC